MPILTENKDIKLMCSDHKVAKIYCQNEVIYSSGNIVTYHVSPGVTYQEEVDEGASCLSPKTFTPSLSGWAFVGWRGDASANANVHQSLVMGDAPITLYAVFAQTITLSYNGNGATGGSTAAQTGTRYYNNGNVVNPSFQIAACGFVRSGYIFVGWSSYSVGQTVQLSSNTSLAAQWYTASAITYNYNGGVQTYTVPYTGTYKLTAYGACGGMAKCGAWPEAPEANHGSARGGYGGYASGQIELKKGTVIYIVVGGKGADGIGGKINNVSQEGASSAGGYNGGGFSGNSYVGRPWMIGKSGGGGATHIALVSGTLKNIGVGNKNNILLVAGGGGGSFVQSWTEEGGKLSRSYGGSGGGTNGEKGTGDGTGVSGYGGTQNGGGNGYDGGNQITTSASGSFGQGGVGTSGGYGTGGGGGLYGGGAGGNWNGGTSGGGGSGFVGSKMISGSTSANGNTTGGHGWATIQLVSA